MYRKAIDLIEDKRKHVSNKLKELLNRNEISIEFYNELTELNERMSHFLVMTFIESEKLIKAGIIEDISNIFEFKEKTKSFEQNFINMKELIDGKLGSHNAIIQKLAMDIIHNSSEYITFLKEYNLSSNLPLDVDSFYKISTEALLIGYIPFDFLKELSLLYTHMKIAIKSIYKWIEENIVYISDPPDDWFKPALHTLIVKGGDCDCLTILICSLLKSIGFKTYLGFLPGHVFPAIKFIKILPEKIKKEDLPQEVKKNILELEKKKKIIKSDFFFKIEEFKIPLDATFKYFIKVGEVGEFIDSFDLAFKEEINEKLSILIKELRKMPKKIRKEEERKFEKRLNEIIDTYNKYSSAKYVALD